MTEKDSGVSQVQHPFRGVDPEGEHEGEASKFYILCFNCGKVTPENQWEYLKWDDEGDNLVPNPPGECDPLMRCPSCKWLHTDDDANPGIMEGTQLEMHSERRENADTYADLWNAPCR